MSQSSSPIDRRLLAAVRIILVITGWVYAVIAGVLVALIPVILLSPAWLAARFAHNHIAPTAIPSIALLMALGAAIAILGLLFVRALRAIVGSVSLGDPFVPENADRLRRMGWLTLAIQLVLIPATKLIFWFDALPYKPNVHHNSLGVSGGTIVLALVLFILAGVFRQGAAMRDELEGTV